MVLIIPLIVLILYKLSPKFKLLIDTVLSIPKFLIYHIYDRILYFKEKWYLNFMGWGMHVYVGAFGASKTMSMVESAYRLAKRYPQLHIMTNLCLKNFPEHTQILPLKCGKDILNAPPDTLVLIDEIGTIFNSRDFAKSKESVPKILFQHICQCRKRRLMIYGTTQRWGFLDKQLRDICATVRYCQCFFSYPFCRLNRVQVFDAYEYDLAYTNPLLPLRLLDSKVYIQNNKIRSLYDTSEMVDNMLKMDYISDEEILTNRGEIKSDMESIDGIGNKRRYNANKKLR